MISIITITPNNHHDLIRTVDSLTSLGEEEIELIIVNGNPNDEECRAYIDQIRKMAFYKITEIYEKDQGISDAFNKGVKVAKGEGILFLNSGDLLLDREYIVYCNQLLRNRESTLMIHSDALFDDRHLGKIVLKPLLERRVRSKDRGETTKSIMEMITLLPRGMAMWHQAMVVRRELFAIIGLFDLKMKSAMDYEWLCRFYLSLERFQEKAVDQIDYYDLRATILFDGGGVSVTKEWYSIKECWKALYQNKLITFHSLFGWRNLLLFGKRILFFIIRKTLLTFQLLSLFKWLKRYKLNC